MGSKRVKFDKVVQRAEYEKGSDEDPPSQTSDADHESSEEEEEDSDVINVDSDPEEMTSGRFFDHISYE